MQAASIVGPPLSKSMRAASSARWSGLTIDERCIDHADAASTLDVALIDRNSNVSAFDAGCIDGEPTRSHARTFAITIDAGCIDRESATVQIDAGCIEREMEWSHH